MNYYLFSQKKLIVSLANGNRNDHLTSLRPCIILIARLLIFALLTFFVVGYSYADCSIGSGPGSANFSPPDITISSANSAVGTVLWSQQTDFEPTATMTCPSATNVSAAFTYLAPATDSGKKYAGNYTVYNTTVNGIGWTASYDETGSSFSSASSFPFDKSIYGQGFSTAGTKGSMALIVTGKISGGVIIYKQYARYSLDFQDFMHWVIIRSVTVNSSGCEVTGNANISVNLGTVGTGKLPAVGSVSNNTPFSINLSCNPGAKVSLNVSGTADTSYPGTLVNNGSAGGVGVQVLMDNGSPLTLNQQFVAIDSAASTDAISLSGQIIRTGKITAGSISSSATYTLNYQ
ncbi:fimbrial protein [Rahnella contaminans]|uniref:fimbrial protein n=1 Tax=Rahnella contaminans TaxID=2703882 RepID=UPI003C2EC428